MTMKKSAWMVLLVAAAIGGFAAWQRGSAAIPEPTREEKTLEQQLATPLDFDYQKRPLPEVLDDLRSRAHLKITVDQLALDADGLRLDRDVTYRRRSMPVAEALRQILWENRLVSTIQDGVVVVTTERKASRQNLQRRLYPVEKLIVGNGRKSGEELLIAFIVDSIEPYSWDTMGGSGHIEYYPLNMCIVVTQPPEVHERIQLLLDRLRDLQAHWTAK